ncbi:MAG TPA: hypothetical protein VLW84_13365 [Terriglobales bacterium]|nr:hypothetical protein [Terriglobales bacterium]
MKTFLVILTTISLLGAVALATDHIPPLPKILNNARYVYVTAYDGDQFDRNLLPEDRQAIASVQEAIEKSGKFILVYQPGQADIVLMVQSRPTEDVLAVYDAHGWPRNQYLWRVMGPGGLQQGETPFVAQFLQAFEKAAGKTP